MFNKYSSWFCLGIVFIVVVGICCGIGYLVYNVDKQNFHSEEKEGYTNIHYSKTCIEGKEFIYTSGTQYFSGLTMNFNEDGKPILCKEK